MGACLKGVENVSQDGTKAVSLLCGALLGNTSLVQV